MRGNCRSLPWVPLFLVLVVVMGTMSRAGQPSVESTSPKTMQVTFTGKVLDGQDKPVADANVVFYEVSYDDSGAFPTAKRVKNVIIGPDGAFVFTTPQEQDGYRQGSIIVRKEGLALGWAAWNIREGNQQSDIKLGEPKELSGIVVDEGDGPIVEAEVSLALGIIAPSRIVVT